LHKIGSALSTITHCLLTMGKTILLGTTLAVVFAVFMIAPALAGGHLMITEAEVDGDEAEIEVAADIPTDGSAGDFGYGFFTTDGKVVAITTHGGIGDDSKKQKSDTDPRFHSHLVELTADDNVADECDVDADKGMFAIVSASFKDIADFEVEDNEVEIEDIKKKAGKLNGDVVSFTLFAEEDGEICLQVIDDATAEDDDDD